MVNYANGKIYKLVSNHTDEVYYGSTTQSLSLRKGQHANQYRRWREGKSNYTASFKLFELGKVDIILVEECKYENKEQLHARERYYIEKSDCLNKQIPGRTIKEWYTANKDKMVEYRKEYREKNKDKLQSWFSGYYQKNKDYLKKKAGENYSKNREEKLAYVKSYREKNKEKIKQKKKEYREKNKEKIKERESQKVTCECGSRVAKKRIKKHKTSNKHQNYIKSLE